MVLNQQLVDALSEEGYFIALNEVCPNRSLDYLCIVLGCPPLHYKPSLPFVFFGGLTSTGCSPWCLVRVAVAAAAMALSASNSRTAIS
jgi:hypothetical protein